MDEIYRKMIEQIALDNEDFTDKEMKELYELQNSKLDELYSLLGALFIKYGVNGLLKLSPIQETSIRAEIKDKLKSIGKELGKAEVIKTTNTLTAIFEDSYYKNAYIMDSGLKVELDFKLLKKEFVEAAVNAKYKGEFFSDRIWANKAGMIDKLQSSLIDAMKGNTTIDKISRDIKKTFNVHAYESKRLSVTEMARVQAQAFITIAENSDVKEIMWSATLDNKTNPEDAALDGKRWSIDGNYPKPPLHPNCRCCLISVPFASWQPTTRKDNESKNIIDYADYSSWKKDKGINKN
jgi:SPP1 gp7 family putative phage head morphogenesis protein